MNLTTSLSNAPEMNAAHGLRRMRGLLTAAAFCVLSITIAGCGDGVSNRTGAGNGASSPSGPAAPANNAAPGAGGASAAVPIVALPASGPCAASGASAAQPVPNTQLVCAP